MVSNNSITIAFHASLLNFHRHIFGSLSTFLGCIWEKTWCWTLSIASDCFSCVYWLMDRILGNIRLNNWRRYIILLLVVLNTKIGKLILWMRDVSLIFAGRDHAITMSCCILSALLLILLGPDNIQQVWETLAKPCNSITLILKWELARSAVNANRILFYAFWLLLLVWPITIFIFLVVSHELVLQLKSYNHLDLPLPANFVSLSQSIFLWLLFLLLTKLYGPQSYLMVINYI